ncbi:MAG: hypothetical protein INQ03_20895 [Candidatus Heimdallarchaeota archaeon]|nr:hypothetical protein [Candidatus Heimdallarchaeota archaeon]
MSTKTSFLDKYTLKRKISLAFLLLFFVFFAQVLVSGNSVYQMQNDYVLNTRQNLVKNDIGKILEYQQEEDKYLKQWSSGLEVTNDPLKYQKLFNETIRIKSEPWYARLELDFGELEKLSGNEILDIQKGRAILANITNEHRKEFLNHAYSNIFILPSLDTLKNIENHLTASVGEINQMVTILYNYYLLRPSGFSALFNQQISTIEDVGISLVDDFYDIQSINESLYNDYNDFKLDYDLRYQDIKNLYNSLKNTIAETESFENATESEREQIQRLFYFLDGNITSFESFIESRKIFNQNIVYELIRATGRATNILQKLSDEFQKIVIWADEGQVLLLQRFSTTLLIQIIVLLAIAAIGITILFLVNRQISKEIIEPIEVIALWSEYISEGDLTKTRKIRARQDEVGTLERSFKNMNNNLRNIIQGIHDTNELIAYTSEELSSNTEEVNATAEEVSAIAQSMATGSTQQAEIITTIVEELQEANDVVDSVINQITHNLSIVKDLSEQTNVLALNTAIEAANAGEFGRGFTVIAENIRKMSDQSSRTAKVITRDSKAILNQLQTTFGIITEKIENVAAVSEETAASAEEVAASAEELTATMENISAKSAILNDQSVNSMISVSRFILTEEDALKRQRDHKLPKHEDLVVEDALNEQEGKNSEEQAAKEIDTNEKN